MRHLALFLLILFLLSGCATSRGTEKSVPIRIKTAADSNLYPLNLMDDRGKAVSIEAQPKRIISLSPNCTEILYALGLGNRVVGVTTYCNYPEAATSKPKIGDANVSVEKVLALQPDLIVAHAYLNDSVVRRLEGMGLTVLALDAKTEKEVEEDILLVGRACDRKAAASSLASRLSARFRETARVCGGTKGPRVLVIVQTNPLWTAGPKTLVDEMLSICNSRNIAFDARPGFNLFPVERALARDPEVIVVGRDADREFFVKSPVWKNTSAVRSGRIITIDADLLVRPGPRLVDGLSKLAKALRPEH